MPLVLNPVVLPDNTDPSRLEDLIASPVRAFQNVFADITQQTNQFIVGFRKLTWEELAELVEIAICSSADPMTLRFEDSVQCDHPAPLYQARLTGSLVVDSPFRRDSVDEPHALRSLINTLLRLGAIRTVRYRIARMPIEKARFITQLERGTVPLMSEDGLCSMYLKVVEGGKWEFLARSVISRVVRERGCVVSIFEVEPALRGRLHLCK